MAELLKDMFAVMGALVILIVGVLYIVYQSKR
jgi:hypothetical protein